MKEFLVGMMSQGENEYPAALQSLRSQASQDWELFEIRNQPNAEAHQTLYRTFMENAGRFRFFLKLDADMVLRSRSALEQLRALFDPPDLDQVMTDVADWASGQLIPGMQSFSNRVT